MKDKICYLVLCKCSFSYCLLLIDFFTYFSFLVYIKFSLHQMILKLFFGGRNDVSSNDPERADPPVEYFV